MWSQLQTRGSEQAESEELSGMQVYEFNVPTFGKGVVFDVDHKVSQITILSLEEGAGQSSYSPLLPLDRYPQGVWAACWDNGSLHVADGSTWGCQTCHKLSGRIP